MDIRIYSSPSTISKCVLPDRKVSLNASPILLRKAMAVTLSNLRRIVLCVLVAKVLRARNPASITAKTLGLI